MAKRLKLALVLGGGVSLGAFSGGALAEVVRQLARNLDTDEYTDPEIDVLAGASAGALTLALLLRVLANPERRPPGRVVQALLSAQRRAWVERVGIGALIPDRRMPVAAVLDRLAVDNLARELIAWPEAPPRPHPLLAERVHVGMTLLNYNGIPIRTSTDPTLVDATSTTLFRDYRIFCLDFADAELPVPSRWRRFGPQELAEASAWRTLAATAVAGGAFPLAFEPVVLERRRSEYGGLWPEELAAKQSFPFTFGDGGTFDNEPLREAMRMIAEQDQWEEPESFERLLIFIDPNLSGTHEDFQLAFHLPVQVNADFGLWDGRDVVQSDYGGRFASTAARLFEAVKSQAAYRDILASEKVNNRLQWRQSLRELVDAIAASATDGAERDAMTALAAVLRDKNRATRTQTERQRGRRVSTRSRALKQELERVHLEYEGRRVPYREMPPRQRLRNALFSLVDQVADLRRKQVVSVLGIGPTRFVPVGGGDPVPIELAGNFLANFGGFFHKPYRAHDFQAGRAMAGSALATTGVGRLLEDPAAREDYAGWPGPDPTIDTVPEGKDLLFDRVATLIGRVVRDAVPKPLVRDLAAAIARRVARRGASFLGAAPDVRREPAIVRVAVVNARAGEEVFYLEGHGENGDDSARQRADAAGRAEILTLVYFPPQPGGERELGGPHVLRHGGRWHLELREHARWRADRRRLVPLPTLTQLRRGLRLALAIHHAQVDWSDPDAPVEWRLEEGLRSLEQSWTRR